MLSTQSDEKKTGAFASEPAALLRMVVHLLFDVAAWLSAWTIGSVVARRYFGAAATRTPLRDPGYFIALALGIAVGRLGCFFGGLPDYTYGTPTGLAWGVDFGDGVPRHPVQLYESAAMLLFLAFYLRGLAADSQLVRKHGFYLFVGWYALQRFAWEFLKPYPSVAGPLNVFHLICIVLIGYSVFMVRQTDELRAPV